MMFRLHHSKRARFGLILCMLACLLGGCWDSQEVNDLAIVTAVGIDQYEDQRIQLSIQVIVPQALEGGQSMGGGSGGGGRMIEVMTAEGVNIADARARIQEKLPRSIFWNHAKVVVIGEEAARKGIRKHLDFFTRHNDTRLQTLYFVSKGKAVEILKQQPPIEKYSGEKLREMAKLQFGLKVTLKELLQMLNGDSGAAVLPWLEQAPASPPGKTRKLHLDGAAIFREDKMVGRIDSEVARGLLWIRNEIKLATVTITPEETEGYVSLKLLHSRTELIPSIQNDRWIMTVQTVTEDDMIENTTNLNPMDVKVVKKLEQEASKSLKERMELSLKRVQKEYKADVFGFAGAFHRHFPKEWNQVKDRWNEMFPEVEVKVNARIYIRRPGTSTIPTSVPEKEVMK